MFAEAVYGWPHEATSSLEDLNPPPRPWTEGSEAGASARKQAKSSAVQRSATSSIDLVKVTPQLCPNRFPNPGKGWGIEEEETVILDTLYRKVGGLLSASWTRGKSALHHAPRLILVRLGLLTELQEEVQRLQRVNAELVDLDRMRNELFGNTVHELKTPLVTIRGYSDMLHSERMGPLSEAQRQAITVVRKNAKTLNNKIDYLLKACQNRDFALPLEEQAFPFDKFIENIAERHRPAAVSKEVTLHFEVEQEGLMLYGDRRRLREVLDNIVSNAIKFTDPGGRVWVRAGMPRRDRLPVEVMDTGCGIDEEAMDLIFERFQQADGTIRRRYGGSGLGLAIAQSNLRLHGSDIRVESEKGAGASFIFELPLARESEGPS